MVDLRRAPMGSDNRPFIAPNMFPLGYMTQFTGVTDDVANGVEAGGDLLALTSSEIETVTLEIQFIKKFYLAGGAAAWKSAVLGDWVKFALHAPASPATENTGAGAYDKYPLGTGMNMFIPNATATGNWDLNLTEKLNANVDFTKVVPVPASADPELQNQYTGFFDWNVDTGDVTLNAAQQGRYNLFDFEVPLHTFVEKVPLLGDSFQAFTVPAVKPYLCLPHWHIRLSLYNSTEKTMQLTAMLYRGVK